MNFNRQWRFALTLLVAAAFAVPALAQQPEPAAPEAAAPAPAKPKPKPAAKPAATGPAAAVAGGAQPKLLGQYGEWGAYTASPGGKKICFAIAKPTSAETNPPGRPRNPPYMFISTRPEDK